MDRSRKTSTVPSNLKLEPLRLKTQKSNNNSKAKHTASFQSVCENSYTVPNKMASIIQSDDVKDLQRKILGFDAKDDSNITSRHLFELRRSYDEMAKQITKKEFQSESLRGEIEVMKRTILLSRQSEGASKRNMEQLQKNVENVRSKHIFEQKGSKTLEHMINRMKKDEFIHKTRVGVLRKKVNQLQSLIKDSDVKSLIMTEHQSSNIVAMSKIKQEYCQTTKQRLINFDLYQSLILKRQEGQMAEEQRQRATEEIQAIASSDLNDANLIKWRKLLMVQIFLRRILKVKISNVEDKYKDFTRCYNSIRTKTTINTPNELSEAYFQMENVYKQSLEKVSELQRRQKQLSFQREQLQRQWKSQQAQYWECNQQSSQEQLQITQRNDVFQKWMKLSLIQITIKNWIQNRLEKLNIFQTEGLRNIQKGQYDDIQNSIKQYCKNLFNLQEDLIKTDQPLLRFEQLKCLESTIQKGSFDEQLSDKEPTLQHKRPKQ